MNILQVFNGFSQRWNANAYYALTQAEGLIQRGHSVWCIANKDSVFLQKCTERNIPVYPLTVDTNNPLRYWSIRNTIRTIINKHNITIVNCHRGMVFLAYLEAAKKANHSVQVIRTHGEPRYPHIGKMSKFQALLTPKIITTTEKLKRYYINKLNIPPEKVHTLFGGVSYEFEHLRTACTPLPAHKKLILGMLGRISTVKGHIVLIKALGKVLQQTQYPIILHIAGGHKQEDFTRLKEYAQAENISKENLIIHGHVDNAAEFINTIDVGIVPSLGSEMICRVVMEYTALGKAVIGSDINSVGEVIRAYKLGLTFPAGDSDALAKHILTLAESPEQLSYYQQKSREAYTTIFHPDRFAEQTEKIFTSPTHPASS